MSVFLLNVVSFVRSAACGAEWKDSLGKGLGNELNFVSL